MFRPWEVDEIQHDMDVDMSDFEIDVDVEENNVENHLHKPTRKHLHPDAKVIVRNVYATLCEDDCHDALKQTSRLTKVPYPTVCKIITAANLDRKKYTSSVQSFGDKFGGEIKEIIYNQYKTNEVATLHGIIEKLRECGYDEGISKSTLHRYLLSVGFAYKTLDKRAAIMESERLRRERVKYIERIRAYRNENRNIIYLDETWYDTHDVKSKGWVDASQKCFLNTPPNRGKRVTILHAGGSTGWVENALLISAKNMAKCAADYHQDMDSSLFENWFSNQLLPNIPANSVIVMDNARYHSRQFNKKPNQSTKKEDIIQFMARNYITVPEKATKKDLLDIINQKNIPIQYIIDNLANSKGHTVLRLPPYYCIFNPIKLVWSTLKRNVRKHNTSPNISDSVVSLIRSEVQQVDSNLWTNCIKHVIDVENVYVSSPDIDNFIIQLDENEDDDEISE